MIGSTDIQFEMERADLRFKLEQAIATLPERCREIFIEICVEGNSYAAIAEKYNLSVNTIKVQVSKAYQILREELSHDCFIVHFPDNQDCQSSIVFGIRRKEKLRRSGVVVGWPGYVFP